MALFVIAEDGFSAIPDPHLQDIPEFRALLDRDKTKGKARAHREFLYIYHTADPSSPYASYEEGFRNEKIIAAFLPEGWKPDPEVWEAVKAYKALKLSPSAVLLDSALQAVHKLERFFKEVDLSARDKNNRPIYKPSDITGPLKDMGNIVKGLADLVEQVKMEQQERTATRGGVKVNKYSE